MQSGKSDISTEVASVDGRETTNPGIRYISIGNPLYVRPKPYCIHVKPTRCDLEVSHISAVHLLRHARQFELITGNSGMVDSGMGPDYRVYLFYLFIYYKITSLTSAEKQQKTPVSKCDKQDKRTQYNKFVLEKKTVKHTN